MLFIVSPIVRFINCSMFCCTLLHVHSSFAIFLMGNRELVAMLSLPFWCLVIVVWLFLAVPWVCMQFVIVVFPDHSHLLFFLVLRHTVLATLSIGSFYFKRLMQNTLSEPVRLEHMCISKLL